MARYLSWHWLAEMRAENEMMASELAGRKVAVKVRRRKHPRKCKRVLGVRISKRKRKGRVFFSIL